MKPIIQISILLIVAFFHSTESTGQVKKVGNNFILLDSAFVANKSKNTSKAKDRKQRIKHSAVLLPSQLFPLPNGNKDVKTGKKRTTKYINRKSPRDYGTANNQLLNFDEADALFGKRTNIKAKRLKKE